MLFFIYMNFYLLSIAFYCLLYLLCFFSFSAPSRFHFEIGFFHFAIIYIRHVNYNMLKKKGQQYIMGDDGGRVTYLY